MVYIYILQLEENKFYIGKTNNPNIRIANHYNKNNNTIWTKIYRPIKVLKIISNCDDYDEDKYTIMYMNRYGIENVRGGSFCMLKLDDITIEQIKRMCNGANNKCFICGKEGHFAKECKEDKEDKEDLDFTIIDFTKKDDYEYNKDNNCCFRCGRKGHYISSCFANTHINGKKLN